RSPPVGADASASTWPSWSTRAALMLVPPRSMPIYCMVVPPSEWVSDGAPRGRFANTGRDREIQRRQQGGKGPAGAPAGKAPSPHDLGPVLPGRKGEGKLGA